ncbi:hypothetical protein JW979_14460, partial [bacterium]|nr:hypothetical protein [candidate division CSSED10-310 bacterium]
LEAQLKQWGVRLEELAARADKAGSDAREEAKADYNKRVVDLKKKYTAAQKKLVEFRAAGDGKWDNFKSDVETLWKDIEVAFKGLTHK